MSNLQRFFFLICIYVLIGTGCLVVSGGIKLESDLAKLFPQSTYNPAVSAFNQRLEAAYSSHLALAIKSVNQAEVPRIKQQLQDLVSAHPIVAFSAPEQAEAYSEAYHGLIQYRFALLSNQTLERLDSGNTQLFTERARASLMGANSSALSFIEDPFNFASELQPFVTPQMEGEVEAPFIIFNRQTESIILLPLQLQAPSFSLTAHAQITAFLNDLKLSLTNEFEPTPDVYVSGLVFHAAAASTTAAREMQTIGMGSVIGIIILFLLLFRRISPLIYSLISIAFGVGGAFLTTHLIFGRVHLITLVFGASLIGIAVDYALHYLCQCQSDFAKRLVPSDVLKNVVPALAMGLVTSVLGFSCLVTADLPGLQQVAVFSISGLVFAWLIVVALFPALVRTSLPSSIKFLNLAVELLWAKRPPPYIRYVFGIGLVVLVVTGGMSISLNYSARALYNPSAELLSSEKEVQALANSFALNQYFLIKGRDSDELLARDAILRSQLQDWVDTGEINGFRTLSAIVPPKANQRENCALVRRTLYQENGPLYEFFNSLGLSNVDFGKAQLAFEASCQRVLGVGEWLQFATSMDRSLVLAPGDGSPDQFYYSVAMLAGVTSIEAMAKYQQDGVEFVDRVAVLSDQLHRLVVEAIKLFILALAVIMVVLFAYYRHVRGWLLLVLPLSVIALTLSTISMLGIPINLFHILACFLLLGLGMDYCIFAAFGGQDSHTQRAICMSAITSILSFGLLSLSDTPMIQSFGLALVIGGIGNLLLSPYSPRNILRKKGD